MKSGQEFGLHVEDRSPGPEDLSPSSVDGTAHGDVRRLSEHGFRERGHAIRPMSHVTFRWLVGDAISSSTCCRIGRRTPTRGHCGLHADARPQMVDLALDGGRTLSLSGRRTRLPGTTPEIRPHAPGHPQSAVRRSGGAEGHRAGSSPSRCTGSELDRVVDILFHLPVGWIDRKRVERARRGRCRPDDHRRADRARLSPERGARPVPHLRRGPGRQLRHAHLFQQSGLGEEAAAARRGADRLGQARPLRPGTADRPSGLCAAARPRRRRFPSASRSIRCPKGSPTTGSADLAGQALARRPDARRMDRAEPARRSAAGRTGPRRSRPRIAIPAAAEGARAARL